MPTKRPTLRLTDERKQLLDETTEIVADGTEDDPPMADVIDAALTHLVESEQIRVNPDEGPNPILFRDPKTEMFVAVAPRVSK